MHFCRTFALLALVVGSSTHASTDSESGSIYHVWYELELDDYTRITSKRTEQPLTHDACAAEIAKRENVTPLRGKRLELENGTQGIIVGRYCAAPDGSRFAIPEPKRVKPEKPNPTSVKELTPGYRVWTRYGMNDQQTFVEARDEPVTETKAACDLWIRDRSGDVPTTVTMQVRVHGVWREYMAQLQKIWCSYEGSSSPIPKPDATVAWILLEKGNGEQWMIPWLPPVRADQSPEECRRQQEDDENRRPLVNRPLTTWGYEGTVIARRCESAGSFMSHRMQ